jgi:hypothetical protein
MKKIFFLIIVVLPFANTFGQSPDWTFDKSQYLHAMTFVISVNHNGTFLSSSNDKVAAFVDGEIRGSSNLSFITKANRYLAYLVVYSKTINETITFKFYDSVNNQVVNASNTVLFEIDRHYGDIFQTFPISNTTLSSEANIVNFNFSGAETAISMIADSTVTIASNEFIVDNITQLNAIFELSPGAVLYDNDVPKKKILSGSNSIDFSIPRIVNVLSSDETTVKAWTVEINRTWYLGVDADADSFFGSITSVTQATSPGAGYSTVAPTMNDCDDSDPAINPNTVWYIGVDNDADGFIGIVNSVIQCTSPGSGYSTTPPTIDDCDDSDYDINPNTIWDLNQDNDGDGFFESISSATQCTSPGPEYTIRNPNMNYWNGSSNSDWNTATNWSLGSVPTSTDEVSIPSGLSNYPIIPTNTNAAASTFTIFSGASLTLSKTSTLSVSGNFTNSGATVTLHSDSDEFSLLLVSGIASGDITYNRYVNSVSAGWDLIGSPVSGLPFSTFIVNTNMATNGSFYAVGSYDNTTDTWTNATSTTTGNLQLGEGYQMATTSGGILTFTGAIANGDQSVIIQNNDDANSGVGRRWNLIANPFVSYLNGNSIADGTNNFLTVNTAAIDDNFEAIYGWNSTGYTIYNHTSTATYIAPGQGFFVAAAGSSEAQTIHFTKAMQTVTGTDDFIASKTSGTSYELVLEMRQEATKLGDTKFYFKEGLTLGLDPGYDAGAFNQGAALSSRLLAQDKGVNMGVNAMSIDDMQNVVVPLMINQEAGKPVAIRIANHTLPADIHVYVEDVLEKTVTLVTAQSFELTPQTKLSGIGRFYVHFTRKTLSTETRVASSVLTAYKAIGNDYITIEGLAQFSKPSQINVYNLLGMKLIESTLQTPSDKEMIPITGIKQGIYILEVNTDKRVFTKKIIIN